MSLDCWRTHPNALRLNEMLVIVVHQVIAPDLNSNCCRPHYGHVLHFDLLHVVYSNYLNWSEIYRCRQRYQRCYFDSIGYRSCLRYRMMMMLMPNQTMPFDRFHWNPSLWSTVFSDALDVAGNVFCESTESLKKEKKKETRKKNP